MGQVLLLSLKQKKKKNPAHAHEQGVVSGEHGTKSLRFCEKGVLLHPTLRMEATDGRSKPGEASLSWQEAGC